jgi:hypothetical protein
VLSATTVSASAKGQIGASWKFMPCQSPRVSGPRSPKHGKMDSIARLGSTRAVTRLAAGTSSRPQRLCTQLELVVGSCLCAQRLCARVVVRVAHMKPWSSLGPGRPSRPVTRTRAGHGILRQLGPGPYSGRPRRPSSARHVTHVPHAAARVVDHRFSTVTPPTAARGPPEPRTSRCGVCRHAQPFGRAFLA